MDDLPLRKQAGDSGERQSAEDERLLGELAKRSKSVGPFAKPFKSVVKNWKVQRNISNEQTALLALQEWQSIVGPALASYTRPGHIRRGAFEVFVDSPLVMQELMMQRTTILIELQRRLPDHNIKSLKFRTR